MIITIGGQYGCGGKRIAERAAELLGCTLCDDNLVSEAVKNSNVDLKEETFRYFDESQGTGSTRELSRLIGIQNNLGLAITSLTLDTPPLDRRIAETQKEIFDNLAQKGDCIFLGRCADYYLRDYPNRASVYVIDELEQREQRIMEYFKIDAAEAKKLINKTDKRRSDYYSFFTGRKWGDIENYDMILRCGLLGIEGSAKLLCQLGEALRG